MQILRKLLIFILVVSIFTLPISAQEDEMKEGLIGKSERELTKKEVAKFRESTSNQKGSENIIWNQIVAVDQNRLTINTANMGLDAVELVVLKVVVVTPYGPVHKTITEASILPFISRSNKLYYANWQTVTILATSYVVDDGITVNLSPQSLVNPN